MTHATTRLATALLAPALVAIGCDDATTTGGPTRRSDAVAAGTNQKTSATAPTGIPSVSSTPRQGPLCGAKGEDTKLPETTFGAISRTDAKSELEPKLPEGTWLWLNFWAAWCGPCKEEIPRILAFQKKLAADGIQMRVGFISLDDDERQARRFLDGQPKDGLGDTLWLDEGERRSKFLSGLALGTTPNLPVQLFVRPDRTVRCTVKGAVEDGDYAEIAALARGR